jgi:hypothetical protein
MRGKTTLYNDLIPSSIPDTLGEKSQRNTFLDRRDDKLAHRYYYHAHLIRRRYDDCLSELHLEFDLTPNVIVQRLSSRVDMIKALVNQETTPSELRKKYPFYNWAVVRVG